jgi:hypothetical protein
LLDSELITLYEGPRLKEQHAALKTYMIKDEVKAKEFLTTDGILPCRNADYKSRTIKKPKVESASRTFTDPLSMGFFGSHRKV